MPQYSIVPRTGGTLSLLNVSASTVVKATPGTAWRVVVNTAGSTAGALYDTTLVASVGAANLICAIPNTANAIIDVEWPCAAGIVYVPGTGQVASISYS